MDNIETASKTLTIFYAGLGFFGASFVCVFIASIAMLPFLWVLCAFKFLTVGGI